jgi:DNA polymerase-3 subunit gamma/tau
VDAPLALYRRYRPERFADVLGQDHVTGPLRQALAGNRVHHAYLFSGPRGCGKTTSARILARALNCEQAPVAEPCGECQSCRDLARDGPGSLDVIEIDAASHGGVDDARELRERASFGPMSSRYKVYIVDEAHMVTPQGFNALLKVVEEPPPHVKFVFATTEPDRVLPTIRSRTHHYPFRLLPPRLLTDYLAEICDREGIAVEPAALPLVVRAGGGSARDTLSVLDQLIGGAGDEGLTYPLATGLLGFTPESLLDEVIDAFAAEDGAAVFQVVDRVVEGGREPRRFVEDLLGRLRDLIVLAHVPAAARDGLLDVSPEQGERLAGQAARFGAADLVRAAEVVATALGEIRGATAPRLLLELMCARVLLPATDDDVAGVQARLDRIERRLAIAGSQAGAAHAAASAQPVEAAHPASTAEPEADKTLRRRDPRPASSADRPDHSESPAATLPAEPITGAAPESAPEPSAPTSGPPPEPSAGARLGSPDASAVAPPAVAAAGAPLGLIDVRRAWPDVVERTKSARRLAWSLLSQSAQVHALDGRTLTVAFVNAGSRESFARNGCDEVLRQVLIDVLGVDWRVESIVDPSASAASAASPAAGPAGPPQASTPPDQERAARQPVESGAASTTAASAAATSSPATSSTAAASTSAASTSAASTTAASTMGAPPAATATSDGAHVDDPDMEVDGDTQELLTRELGAQVIEEIPHQP